MGSPRINRFWEAFRKMGREAKEIGGPSEQQEIENEAYTPLFDCATEPPILRREVMRPDVPSKTHDRLKYLTKSVLEGRMKPEEAKRQRRDLWSDDRPTWDDYTPEEQEEHRTAWAKWARQGDDSEVPF